MEFEWDEAKRTGNVDKHGIDFVDAVRLFDGRPVFTYESPRGTEPRWGTVGLLEIAGEADFYLVVWTSRGEWTRIVAAYRADDWEIREYRRLFG